MFADDHAVVIELKNESESTEKSTEKRFYYNNLCFLFSVAVASGFLFGTSFFRHSSLSSSSRSQSGAQHENDNMSKTDVAPWRYEWDGMGMDGSLGGLPCLSQNEEYLSLKSLRLR